MLFLQNTMARALKVTLQVILYLVDVVSDWINGVEQIYVQQIQTSKEEIKLVNSSLEIINCQTISQGPTLGIITIGLSWFPGIIALIFYKNLQPNEPIYMIIARFITWPLYVPFQIFVTGMWPDSKLAKSFIFPQTNDYGVDNYSLGMYFKCLEGVSEAGPQLVIQIVTMFQGLSPSVFQIMAVSTSALTLTISNIELYFMMQDEKKSWWKILKRNLLVTPYFLVNSMFKILTMGLIFAIFNLWGILILFMWGFIYNRMVLYLHRMPVYISPVVNLLYLGPLNSIILTGSPGPLCPSYKWEFIKFKNGTLGKGPPVRYKAVMRISVWMNFCFFTIWLLYGPALQLITAGQRYSGHFRESGITVDCILGDDLLTITLVILSIGLFSCVIVEVYLSKFPQILGLNPDNDFCSPSTEEVSDEMNGGIVNDTFEMADTLKVKRKWTPIL